MEKQKKLEQLIEKARMEMLALSKNYPLTSSVVVEASQKLDRLLNQHVSLKIG